MKWKDTSILYDVVFNKCKIFFVKNGYMNFNVDNNLLLVSFNQENWISLVNYSVLSMVKMNRRKIRKEYVMYDYDKCMRVARIVMEKKNSDYKEAWKAMSFSSIKDIILQKIFRIQGIQRNECLIKKNQNKIKDNYIDILNYAIFILIRNDFSMLL